MLTILEAMAREEGFGADPANRATRNNNPGNIERGRFATAHGAQGDDGRFAIFPNAAAGFACMRALLQSPGYKGMTVEETLRKYAPANENDTKTYILRVCEWSGLRPNSIIDASVAQLTDLELDGPD
jgi:hypothetical protein